MIRIASPVAYYIRVIPTERCFYLYTDIIIRLFRPDKMHQTLDKTPATKLLSNKKYLVVKLSHVNWFSASLPQYIHATYFDWDAHNLFILRELLNKNKNAVYCTTTTTTHQYKYVFIYAQLRLEYFFLYKMINIARSKLTQIHTKG